MTMNDVAPERAGNAIVRLGSFWMISAEPHVMMRLKRLWGGIAKGQRGELRIKRSPAVDFEVRWMLDGPWEFEISAADRIDLHRGAEEHTRSQKRVLTILDGKAPPLDVEMGVTPRDYQLVAAAWWKETKRSILADTLGTGKTISALTALADPKLRPAAIVCETHLAIQWAGEIRRAFPGARVHIIKQGTPYDVVAATRREEQRAGKPMGTGWPEFVVLNYHKLDGWASTLSKHGLASLVYDECQALRHNETKRYAGAVLLAATVPYILGMSATPVWNYGGAIINIVDVIRPGFLGERDEFYREWCGEGEERKKLILDQRAFGRHLRESGFMLRRTREEVGRELPALTIAPTLIDTDGPQLDTDRMTLRRLAETILTRQTGPQAGLTAMQAARDFDVKLRKITGAAKAPAVADLARMMVESGEKVVIGAWHREVWDLLALRLKDYSPAFITGHETPKQKNESKRRFLDGETPILGVSLASCAGLDGLQHVCATGILAELAWTPKIHEQLFGRLHRDGQKRPVTWTVAYANWGSDPIVMDVCGVKDAQSRPIVDPDAVIADFQADPEHVKRLARDFLERHR